MKIKDRLAIYFTLASTLMLLIVLFATYFTFSKFMEADFFDRLTDRTMVTANLYLEADELSAEALRKNRSQYYDKLSREEIRIYDASNHPVFIDSKAGLWEKETIEKVRREGKVKFKIDETQVVGIFYKDNQGDFVILASAVDRSTMYRLEKLKTVMFFIFIFIFVALLLSSRSIARRILKPLDVFIDEVKLIKSSNLNHRVQGGKNKDEIGLLASNFNELMAHLEQAFVLQRTFIANASHELRTPLTSMMIGAEIVLSKEREAEAYRKALSSMLEDAERMDSIIKELLALAQADIEYGSAKLENISLQSMLKSIEAEWNDNAGAAAMVLTLETGENEDVIVSANPTLLKIAINNVIANGFKFSNQNDVNCRMKTEAGSAMIFITDSGPGIPESDQPFIFDPFYSSATRNTKHGSGMGLFMAKKIINLFKGSIELETSSASGTTFIISIPRF